MRTYEFPWPPSVNHYWMHIRGRAFIGKKGRMYRSEVAKQILIQGRHTFTGNLKVTVKMYPPDKRRRDIDNPIKCLLDSMQHGGLYEDDNQIKKLHLEMMTEKGGFVEVSIERIYDKKTDDGKIVELQGLLTDKVN